MRKILFAILCLLFVSCSNLYKANKAYERGDYVENVVLTFKYFDEKPENFKELNEKKKKKMRLIANFQIFLNITQNKKIVRNWKIETGLI